MDIDNSEMQLSLSLNNNTLAIASNFNDLSNRVSCYVAKYTDSTALQEANKNELNVCKKALVHLRTTLSKEFTAWKKGAISNPLALVQAEFDRLITVITDGEKQVDERLDVYEKQRLEALVTVYDRYKQQAVEKYGLQERFAARIVYAKSYFNKTAKEDDVIDDIERQAKEMQQVQADYMQSIDLLKSELTGTQLNVATYIEMLDYGRSFAEVFSLAKRDKALATETKSNTIELDTMRKSKETLDESVKAIDNNEVRTRIIRLTYSKDKASKIKELVTSLQRMGVTVEMIQA